MVFSVTCMIVIALFGSIYISVMWGWHYICKYFSHSIWLWEYSTWECYHLLTIKLFITFAIWVFSRHVGYPIPTNVCLHIPRPSRTSHHAVVLQSDSPWIVQKKNPNIWGPTLSGFIWFYYKLVEIIRQRDQCLSLVVLSVGIVPWFHSQESSFWHPNQKPKASARERWVFPTLAPAALVE